MSTAATLTSSSFLEPEDLDNYVPQIAEIIKNKEA